MKNFDEICKDLDAALNAVLTATPDSRANALRDSVKAISAAKEAMAVDAVNIKQATDIVRQHITVEMMIKNLIPLTNEKL